ncbi:hypothetical protein SAMN05216188_12399 [Lentzea xinjiangensis]|uniref:SMI1-KNR4 cell-wall n=1 Tax=Lentzea xinjiangensis TaxID=402600 RepID=A0A1H9V2C2_9PSEU|nr:hypothetical protein SAMN05216188_12399 [Lentzea xinjiangensis]
MAPRSPAVDVLADIVGWSGSPKWLPDWRITERLLGLSLPDDYKALLSTVPAGKYAGTVRLNAPTRTGYEGDLLALHREVMLSLKDGRKPPYAAFPQLPGLIPWATFDHPMGGELFWLADDGDPNKWPVVARSADGNWEECDVSAVAFLIALVRGKLPSKLLTPKPGAPAYRTSQDLPGAPNNTGR